jgi:septal ring factor EnvC (AmiA/AmiB activator)
MLRYNPLCIILAPLRSRTFPPSLLRTPAAPILLLVLLTAPFAGAQDPTPDMQRITERIQGLQREAERLAGESRTLVVELRQKEVDRALKVEQLRQAEAEADAAQRALQDATDRLSNLELKRINELPDVKTQLVNIYKRGRSGYARLLFGADDVREFARAARAVGALSSITERRLAEHRRTLDALRQERSSFEARATELQARETAARRARAAADAAVASAASLIRQIDSRRDLTAQYAGELQVAYDRIQEQISSIGDDQPPGAPVAIPIRPFQGALEWPAAGRILGAFGQPAARLGGTVARNGIELGVDEGAPVQAIHPGTVGYAGPFTGFGTLVILDHGGNNYSLYGYLDSSPLEQGQMVASGAEVGTAGLAPAGPPALYFELRIDGKSVNPVQWLKPR